MNSNRIIINQLSESSKKYILAIFVIKLIVLGMFSSEYSVQLFQPFLKSYLSEGGNPWQYYFENKLSLDSFPYHGLMLFILALPTAIIDLFGIESTFLSNFIFKLPLLIADVIILIILLKLNPRKEKRVIIFYFLNPVILYAIYVHSQLDIIPMAFLMVALYRLLKGKLIYFSIFLGLALATKMNILIVVPLLFFYLSKKYKVQSSLLYIGVSLSVLLVFDFYYLFSDGFLEMVVFNSKQSLLFDSYIKMGELKFLLPVSAIIVVYFHFFNQKKVNHDLLFFYFVILFTAAIFSVYPAPGWYVWLVPFMAIYFVKNNDREKSVFLYLLLSGVYLSFFIFFYESEYKDILLFNQEIDLKIENEQLRNIAFTVLEVALLTVMYAFYKYGIKSNSVYNVTKNITIGVGGDSGVGKTRFTNGLKSLLVEKFLHIEGDGEHKWERGNENWKKFTHLDPKANHIHKQADAIHDLMLGNSIKRSEYDHATGQFTEPNTIKPKEFIAISGLHPFYLPKSRKTIDLKIYLDTEESLRRHWKIIRDTNKRGYTVEKILEQIEARVPDTEKFIYPQKQYADLRVRFFSVNEFKLGDESEEIQLGLKIEFDANLNIEEILSKLDCDYVWDYNDDLKTQYIELKQIPQTDFRTIALDSIKNLNEIVSTQAEWKTGYDGFVQLISLKMISEILKG